jgi:drug/metabolite transporter (DMT)-like permease
MSTPTADTTSSRRGYIAALGSSVLLSTTAIFIRYLTEAYAIPAVLLAFWRDLLVSLTLLLALAALRPGLLRAGRQHLGYLALYGILLAVFNAVWTLSVALNGASVATVLVYSSTAFTAVLGWRFLHERLDWAKALAVVVCIAGCALVVEAYDPAVWESNLFGILAGLAAGLGYAIYSMLGRAASQRGLNPWTTLLYTFGIASAVLLFFNLLPGGPLPGTASRPGELVWFGDALAGWGILLLLAAVPTLGGFGLYNVSLVHLPSSVANLVLTTEPVFTVLIAYALLGERLSLAQVAGGLLILAGVVLLRLHDPGFTKPSADVGLSAPDSLV